MKYTRQDVQKLGTILGIWAHPDDEAFSSAALMAAARQNGQRVVVITATKGDAGMSSDSERWPLAELAKIRTREQEASLHATGVEEHYWLEYEDGKLATIADEKPVEVLVSFLQKIQPDTVISFDADGITGHDDHKTIHQWALRAVEKSQRDILFLCAKENRDFYEQIGRKLHREHNIYFNTEKPEVVEVESVDVCYKPEPKIQQIKMKALRAHASQTLAMFNTPDGKVALKLLCECECFVRKTL